MANFEKVYKLLEECDGLTKQALHDAMCIVSNTILHSIATIIGKATLEEIDRDTRIHIASKITADINEIIIPLHKLIDGLDKDEKGFEFDGTEFAREMKAISEDLHMVVKAKYKNGGQMIETSVCKQLEVDPEELDEEIRNKLDEMALATVVAKA